MNIAINLETILKNKSIINFIKEQLEENKIYIFIDENKYNKKLQKELKQIMKQSNLNVTDVILTNKEIFDKMIEVRNISFIIDEKNNLNVDNKIPVVTFNNTEKNLITVNNIDELKQYYNNYRNKILNNKDTVLTNLPSEDKIWQRIYNPAQKNVNLPKMSIYDYIYYNNYSNLDSVAIRYFGKEITFKEMFEKIDQFAKSLKKSNIGPGDVVTICMPNTPEGVIAFFAVNKIGAVANLLHPLLKSSDILKTLNITESKYMIMADMCFEEVNSIIDKTDVEKVVVVSPADSMPSIGGIQFGIKHLYKLQNLSEKIKKKLNSKKLVLSKKFVPKKCSDLNISLSIEDEMKKIKSDKLKYGKLYKKWNDELRFGSDYNRTTNSIYKFGEPAVLLKTGGTTGKAKLVTLTNENVISNTSQLRDTIPYYKKQDELLAISPIFHGFGLVDSVVTALAVNMSVDLHPKYNDRIYTKSVLKNKPTLILGVPTLFKAMRKNKKFDNKDLSHLKVMICGGDTLTPEERVKQNRWKLEHNCPYPIFVGMGLTQATAAVSFTGINSKNKHSVGFPLPLNDVKIVNQKTLEELSYNKPGELLISGPTVMKEYYKNKVETENCLLEDKDGKLWLRTGDICYIDENGEICFVDRQDNLIIVSGVNVYSNEIEPIVLEIPEIESCAIIGVPHSYKMNVPKAFVVLKKGFVLDEKLKNKILNHCNEKLDAYHKIYEIEQIDKIPLTALNKIQYSKLRELTSQRNVQKILK